VIRTALILPAAEAGQVHVGDLTVNRMGFGAMRITGKGVWGDPENIDLCKQVLKRATELGVDFFDTADAYGPEVSERLIRETLAPYKGIVVATKGGLTRSGPDEWHSNGTPEHLREACNASLKRLGTQQISVYQLHSPDPVVPFEESVKTLIELQKEGKIKHIGLSNVTLDQLKAALKLTPIVSVQNQYNILRRANQEEIVDFCEQEGIAFIPYFPMGGGLAELGQAPLQRVASKYQAELHQIALAWLLARSPIILPIPGTASIEHLESNIAAASLKLDKSDMALLAQLSD
jgi:pyridoxine 4-dehydrogenase